MKRARLLAFVITAAMATTVFLGGTVARYQTTASIDDTATVAKWGVKLTMAGDLYGYNYNNKDQTDANKPTASTDDDKISVEYDEVSPVSPTDNVAPGTSGDTLKISLTGTTEVDVKITSDIMAQDIYLATGTYAVLYELGKLSETEFNAMQPTGSSDDVFLYTKSDKTFVKDQTWDANEVYYTMQNYVVLSGAYYPVKYSVTNTNTSTTIGDQKITDIAIKFASALNNGGNVLIDNDGVSGDADVHISNAILDCHSNTELGDITNADGQKLDGLTITWQWAFGTQIDDADTVLGVLMADTNADGTTNETNSTYVVKYSGAGSVYNILGVNADGIVNDTATTDPVKEVGSVKTLFDIKITVEQKD